MSTPIIDPKRFSNLVASLVHYATGDHGPTHCSLEAGEIFRAFGIDPWHRVFEEGNFRPVSTDPAGAREAIKVAIAAAAFDWARLNYNAHVVRYEDEPAIPGTAAPSRPAAPRLIRPGGTILPLPALLKALRALRYNLDGGKAGNAVLARSYAILDALIDALKDIVLELLPEYRNAEWAI